MVIDVLPYTICLMVMYVTLCVSKDELSSLASKTLYIMYRWHVYEIDIALLRDASFICWALEPFLPQLQGGVVQVLIIMLMYNLINVNVHVNV